MDHDHSKHGMPGPHDAHTGDTNHATHADPGTHAGHTGHAGRAEAKTHAGHTAVRDGHTTVPLGRLAFSATLHCLTGCSIGEVLGMVIGTALGWANLPTMALAIALAFTFGYALTMRPLLGAGMSLGAAVPLALASDTVSITIMEIVDNAVMLVIPGAMDAHLDSPRFWGSLAVSLVLAGAAAFPVNRWLIARGRGHAVVHKHHGHH